MSGWGIRLKIEVCHCYNVSHHNYNRYMWILIIIIHCILVTKLTLCLWISVLYCTRLSLYWWPLVSCCNQDCSGWLAAGVRLISAAPHCKDQLYWQRQTWAVWGPYRSPSAHRWCQLVEGKKIKRKNSDKKKKNIVEIPGFEPGASYMRSKRSTTELYPHTLPLNVQPTTLNRC